MSHLPATLSPDPFRIFLSGSTDDFGQTRLDLAKAFGRSQLHVIHQKDFPQTQADTVLKLAQLIAPCGILVHLIGRQPGSVANKTSVAEYLAIADQGGGFLQHHPGLRAALGDFSGITYTQWEVLIALHRGMTVFVYGDPTHTDPAHPQRQHLDRLVSARRYTDTFEDLADLKDKIWAALLWHYRQSMPAAQVPEIFRPSNLPSGYIGRLFLGRDDFLEKLRHALQQQTGAAAITQSAPSQTPAATSLAGLGGIGKTHTAVAYADRYRGDYCALLFVSGETPERLSATLAGLCGVLHLDRDGPLPPDEPSRVAAAVRWLTTHTGWLLIVDNVDDPAAAKALTGLLEQLTTGHVLITTRLHHWQDSVTTLDLEVLEPDPAAELLLQLTKDKKIHHFTAEDRAQARLLVEDLGCLPLAIHQAAGYIIEEHLSLQDARAFYQQQARDLLGWFDEVLATKYAAPQDIGPVPVLFTWRASFQRLSPEARRWLRVFAHYSHEPIPDFLRHPVAEADEDTRTRLQVLRKALGEADKYCLLTWEQAGGGFKVHRLVQQIIRLTSSPEERAAALAEGLQLLQESKPGDPLDVRTWPKWNPLQPHAQALCQHAPDQPAPEGLGWLLNELGLLLKTKAPHAQAEPLYRRALAIDEASFGPEHPNVAIDLNNLARLLQDTNRLAEAEPLMRRALGIWETSLGKEHPQVAVGLNNLATLLKATHRLAEAEPLMRRALVIDEASFGPEHPRVAIRLNNLAQLLQDTNRLTEAEPLMRRALALDEASYGKEHPKVAIRLNNLAQLLRVTNRLAEAEPLMRRALAIDEASFGKDHPNVAIDLNNLAQLLQATNRLAEAAPLMRRALGICVASLGAEHPNSRTVQENLDLLLAELGESSSAPGPGESSTGSAE